MVFTSCTKRYSFIHYTAYTRTSHTKFWPLIMNANLFVIWCTCTYNVYLFSSSDSHPEDCSANIYKSMALSVLSGLCADSKLVNEYVIILEK